jgi:hypothetical protein
VVTETQPVVLPTNTTAATNTAVEPTATEPAPTIPAPTATTAPTATNPPPPAPGGDYAVILVEEGDVLNVRSAAGASNPVVASLDPHAAGITLTGEDQQVGGDRWVEIKIPGGSSTGWVNSLYLTESVDPAYFCSDISVTGLISKLNTAMTNKDGALLSSIASPAHGMTVYYFHNGNPANYSPEEARWVFDSTYLMDWGLHPASGLAVKGTFHEEVLPKIQEVFVSNYELTCNQVVTGGVSYPTVWPYSYRNVNFYTVLKPATPGVDLDWRTWLVGVEYVGGKPYIFALIHFFWEP